MVTQEQAKVAARWWGEQLKNPTFKTLSDAERSDPATEAIAMAEMMAGIMPRNTTDMQIAVFVDFLEARILQDEFIVRYGLHVDYGPGPDLADAADAAGILVTPSTFPWKTHMWFQDGGVQVSLGYGAPTEELIVTGADG